MKILFICLGNICRSCTAEEIFRTLAVEQSDLKQRYTVDSAGIIDYHEGELPDSRMRAHARKHGYELTHRSRPILPEDFHKFNLIVAMDNRNYDKLQRMAYTEGVDESIVVKMADYLQHHPEHKSIPDPYYGTERDFELVIELLEDACQNLLHTLEQDV